MANVNIDDDLLLPFIKTALDNELKVGIVWVYTPESTERTSGTVGVSEINSPLTPKEIQDVSPVEVEYHFIKLIKNDEPGIKVIYYTSIKSDPLKLYGHTFTENEFLDYISSKEKLIGIPIPTTTIPSGNSGITTRNMYVRMDIKLYPLDWKLCFEKNPKARISKVAAKIPDLIKQAKTLTIIPKSLDPGFGIVGLRTLGLDDQDEYTFRFPTGNENTSQLFAVRKVVLDKGHRQTIRSDDKQVMNAMIASLGGASSNVLIKAATLDTDDEDATPITQRTMDTASERWIEQYNNLAWDVKK